MYDEVRTARDRAWGATALIFLIAGIAACSGQSCSCITPLKGGFPLAQRRENGIQARMTAGFFQYVSDNATTIVPALLPGGTTFNIPPQCPPSGNQICCGTPPPMCQLSLDPRSLIVTPGAPNKLHFTGTMIIKTIQNLPIGTSVANCVISIDTTRAGSFTMSFAGDIALPVDGGTDLTGLSLSNAIIDNLDDGDVNLNEPGSDALCGLANVGFIKGFIIDYLKGQISGLLGGLVEGQLCEKCTDKSDCSAVATACGGGKCIGPDGVKCVQMLGIEGRASLGSLLGGVTPPTASIDILEAAGGFATADTGLSLGVLGGTAADPHDVCVPLVTPPPSVQVAPSTTFQGDVIPGTSTPYHVGIGVHLSHLTTLGYSFWDAGGLCLSLGSANFQQLSAKTLTFVMPSLADLFRGDDAAMALKFRPQRPPVFKLGKGTFKDNGSGMKVVDEALITMTLEDLAADFYLFVDDRYVRVATLTADLVLPIGLDTDMNGALVPLPGDLSKAFTNFKVLNSELLAESPDQLAAAFPTLFAASFGGLFNAIGTFKLPSFAGLQIHPKLITSTDPDAAGNAQYLAIFSDVVPAPMAIWKPIRTVAQLVGVDTPPTEVFSVRHRDGRQPGVTVAVGNGEPVEWTWTIDHGAFHTFQTAPQLTLTDPVLWLQGKHIVTIRARKPGDPRSLDPRGVDLQFFIDSDAPTGDFAIEGDRIIPRASDRISEVEALRYRIDGGAFVSAAELRVPAGRSPSTLVLEVADEAGNLALLPLAGGSAPAPAQAHGCAMSGRILARGESGGIALLLVAGVLLLRRRRAALALALLLPLSACSHGASGADMESPKDAVGRTHDSKIFDGKMQIAAYDATFGDLAWGQVSLDALDQPFDWIIVDGEDPTAPQDSTDEYRHSSTAPGPDVGSYQSLAITSGGDPRIAYYDATSSAVKYASGGGFPFESHEIDRGSDDGSVRVGLFPSIVLDVYDSPVVAYMATGMGDPTMGFRSELRIASALTDNPHSHADWQIDVIDTTAISCVGRCPSGTACVMKDMVGGKPNTNPAQSSCLTIDLAPCTPACGTSQACVQTQCKDTLVMKGPETLPPGTGLFTKILRNPTNSRLTLVYHDRSLGQLRLATEGADGRIVTAPIDGQLGGMDVGQFAAASFADDGSLHVAYVDAIYGELLYRSVSTGGTPSQVEVVDDGMRDDGPHPVGASASVLASGGPVSILYQDQAASDLLIGQKSGSWGHTPVRAGADGSGFSSHLVTDGTSRYYSSWIFDRSTTPLGSLKLAKVP